MQTHRHRRRRGDRLPDPAWRAPKNNWWARRSMPKRWTRRCARRSPISSLCPICMLPPITGAAPPLVSPSARLPTRCSHALREKTSCALSLSVNGEHAARCRAAHDAARSSARHARRSKGATPVANTASAAPAQSARRCGRALLSDFRAAGRGLGHHDHRRRHAGPGEMSLIQDAFCETHGMQCGYCTPAMVLVAHALLADNPEPTREQIVDAISGNICRCTGYAQIVEAIALAAERMRGVNRPRGATHERGRPPPLCLIRPPRARGPPFCRRQGQIRRRY